MEVKLKRNLLLFNALFIVYGFTILFTNITFQNYLIDFDNKCEKQSQELVNSIALTEYSLIILIAIGSFNLIAALNGIYAVLVGHTTLLFIYGVFLFMLFAVELITMAVIFASFKNFTESVVNCGLNGASGDQLISHGFFVCTSFLGSITITVGVIQVLAISSGCSLAERLRIERFRDNGSVISYIFDENICLENKRKVSVRDAKIFSF